MPPWSSVACAGEDLVHSAGVERAEHRHEGQYLLREVQPGIQSFCGGMLLPATCPLYCMLSRAFHVLRVAVETGDDIATVVRKKENVNVAKRLGVS